MLIDSLGVETTRRCNIKCGHCLRGEPQPKNMDPDALGQLLRSGIEYIGQLVLSGGEPSMVPDVIKGICKELRRHKVGFDGFYIATNAVNITDEFLGAVAMLTRYATHKKMCNVEVSMDFYHRNEDPKENAIRGYYKLLEKFESDIYITQRDLDADHTRGVVGQGRAKTNQISFDKPNCGKVTVADDCIEGLLYLNCDGWVIDGGDWSYREQRYHRLFHVSDTHNLLDMLPVSEVMACEYA